MPPRPSLSARFLTVMRLNQFLASAGLGSRRSCESLIRAGRVQVNGENTTDLSTRVEEGDRVVVDGRPVQSSDFRYFLLHKPRRMLCTASDPEGRPTIFDLIPRDLGRLFYVGRLDYDSEGLVLLTNHGALAQALSHPRHAVEKEYEVRIAPAFRADDRELLLKEIRIEGRPARIDRVRVLRPNLLSLILTQGLKRQIRVTLERLGYTVRRLKRVRLGSLRLGRMSPGQIRPLRKGEIRQLRRMAGKDSR